MVRRLSQRYGFSFAEVMFAVVILGVGFIMIAAMFPVALHQSKSTADETSAAAGALAAANFADAIATKTAMASYPNCIALPTPATSVGVPPWAVSSALWFKIRGNVISADDPRYAWIPFYYHGLDYSLTGNPALPYAQLTMVCVQSTLKPIFDPTDVQWPVTTAPGATQMSQHSNLQGWPVRIMIADGNASLGESDTIGFAPSSAPGAMTNGPDAVAEGAFVILRGSPTTGPDRLTGHIYRVGVRRSDLDGQTKDGVTFTGMQVWELLPGNDFTPEPADPLFPLLSASINNIGSPVEAWVVGRSLKDNSSGIAPFVFEGPSMCVSAYTTNVYCKP